MKKDFELNMIDRAGLHILPEVKKINLSLNSLCR